MKKHKPSALSLILLVTLVLAPVPLGRIHIPHDLGRVMCASGLSQGIGETHVNMDGSLTVLMDDGRVAHLTGPWACVSVEGEKKDVPGPL